MTIRYSQRFLRQYAAAPAEVRKAFDKQARFLLENLNHPSLRVKKYDETLDLWQARVSRGWRFYFTIEADEYRLHDIKRHPK
jgi:mRNA-degrading endonuclease RelE of RelBE toxin-antitoxin system